MNDDEQSARMSLIRLDGEAEIDREFVAQAAGDEPMSEEEREEHLRVRGERGERFFADLLFVLTHITYEPGNAQQLWDLLLSHKSAMSRAMERNVGVAVAAVDLFGNIREELEYPVILEEEQIGLIAQLATKDAMTGLFDHSTFHLKLRRKIRRAKRQGSQVSVIMLDVDRFKRFNDTHGHPAGDRVLKSVAGLVQEEIREEDTACRYGGEEFSIVAPATDRPAAVALAERLRSRVEAELREDGITISLGVGTFPRDASSARALVRVSDAALYRSKQAGRNRVSCADSAAPTAGPPRRAD